MKKGIFLILFLLIQHSIFAQSNDHWDVYMAQWEEGPGSVVLNMDLIHSSPKEDLPFLVITGIVFKKCGDDGLPAKEEFDFLYEVSDMVNNTISNFKKSEMVGSFTYQCERLDYIYVNDTTGIRQRLQDLYTQKFPGNEYYLNLNLDASWKAYREFLYPNEQIFESMANHKVIQQLVSAGDKLEKPRQVDHWLYFKNKKDREKFIGEIKKENFKVENQDFLEDQKMPYQLRISRIDKVDLPTIDKLTWELKEKAKALNGNYDGWETFIIKD